MSSSTYFASAMAILGLGVGALVFLLVFFFGNYILSSVGIMKLMQAKRMDRLYRAWIPFWRYYTLGEIIESEVTDSDMVQQGVTRWIIALYGLAIFVPYLGQIVAFLGSIYVIVVWAIFAGKYRSMPSMIITSILHLPGIGFLILASRINAVGTESLTPQNEAKIVEFTTNQNPNYSYTVSAVEAEKESKPVVSNTAEVSLEPKETTQKSEVAEVKADEVVKAKDITTKAAPKTAAKKTATKAAPKTATKAAPKTATKAAPKTASKKTATKAAPKTAAKKTATKAAPKTAAKKTATKAAPKTAAKKTATKAAPKTAAKKTATKAAPKTAAKKTATKAAPKAAAKKTTAKATSKAATKVEVIELKESETK